MQDRTLRLRSVEKSHRTLLALSRLISLMTTWTLAANQTCAASFGADTAFLKQHTEVIVLKGPGDQARLALVPAWQGRVMTSTTGGENGPSFGWINRELV